jgi:ankyrin repeat protein
MQNVNDGCTPLHYECRYGAIPNVVRMLIGEYAEAVKIQNNDGDLPLHLACKNMASYIVLNLLINHFPESITEKKMMVIILKN